MEQQSAITDIRNENFKPYDIPVKFGLVAGIVKIIISTIQYQFFLTSWGMSMLFTFLSFAIGVTFLCVAGIRQRKAMGGYMDIKQAFQAVFVAAMIMVVISYAYDFIYMRFIDPSMMDTIKESSMAAAERWGAPEERLDAMAKQFDEQNADKMKIGKQLLGFGIYVVAYGFVSFICAAIVKKNKPAYMA